MDIKRIAVLGAGVMGAQIAALAAELGVRCDLLDLDAATAERGKRRLTAMRPAPTSAPDALERIRPGGFDRDLPRLQHADWVIEAIVESERHKTDLWARCAPHLPDSAVLSTNTSGIPIARIAQALPPDTRRRFLGTHFFNPPRVMRLVELIPAAETDADALRGIRQFIADALGKKIVVAKDAPGFITNRIGCFYFLTALRAADELGLTPDEADAISGPLMGRPRSATCRTIDLVGVDVLLDICDNTSAALTDAAERAAFSPPPYLRDMRRRGWLGGKSGQGFYKRETHNGKRRTLTLHPSDMRYRESASAAPALPDGLRDMPDAGARLRALAAAADAGYPAGVFARRTLTRLLAFSAAKVGEVASDIASIDRAMRWGFNWELGPFETWDALGAADFARLMRADGVAPPEWASALAARGGSFYRESDGQTLQATPSGGYIPLPD